MAGKARTDPMMVVVSDGATTLYITDDNGPMHGKLRGPDELEPCRTLVDGKRMLASC